MGGNVRQRMVEGATEVLARRGLQATAFSEVLALTGASRGSIYHHFPGGKAELIEAVIDDYAARVDDRLQALHGRATEAVVLGAIDIWRQPLIANDCDAGCPVAAVTVAAYSTRLLERCRQAVELWTATMASALRSDGHAMDEAVELASLVLASLQGAVLLARAQSQIEPFDRVAGALREYAAQAAG